MTPSPEARQAELINLLGQLTVEAALAGTRQRAYQLALDVHSWAHSARFFACRIAPGAATSDYADNLGFALSDALKNPIAYDLLSLQCDRHFEQTVGFLSSALTTVKRL